MLKRYSTPISYLLVPSDFDLELLPSRLADQLQRPKKVYKEEAECDSEGDGKRREDDNDDVDDDDDIDYY